MLKGVELYKNVFENAEVNKWENIENLLFFEMPPNVDKMWYKNNILSIIIKYLLDKRVV